MSWFNSLAEGASAFGGFLKDNSSTIADIAGVGSAVYGGIQQNKMANMAKKELDLGRESYYRNVLRQDKEDEAINAAAGNVRL